MVIEAGVQPKVLVPFTREHDRGRPRGSAALQAPRPAQPPAARASAPRARWSGPTRARRSTSSPTARIPDALKAQGDDVRVRWIGVGQRGRQRRHHQPRRPAELLRRVQLAGLHVGGELLAASAQTFSLTLTPRRRASWPRRRSPSSRSVRRAVVVPFSRSAAAGCVRARARTCRTTSTPTTSPTRCMPPPRDDLGAPGEPREPVPREGAQDRPAGEARGAEARRLPGRHGGLRRRRGRQREPAARRATAASCSSTPCPRDVPLEVLGRLENPDHHGLGPDAPHHAADRLRQGRRSRTRCASGRSPRARRSWRRRAGRSSTPSRSAIARPCSSASTSSGRDFPLRVAFPLMLSKSLRWLHPAGPRPVEPVAARRASPSCCRSSTG